MKWARNGKPLLLTTSGWNGRKNITEACKRPDRAESHGISHSSDVDQLEPTDTTKTTVIQRDTLRDPTWYSMWSNVILNVIQCDPTGYSIYIYVGVGELIGKRRFYSDRGIWRVRRFSESISRLRLRKDCYGDSLDLRRIDARLRRR